MGVQNLEYEHKNSKRQVTQEGDMGIQRERDMHTENVVRMNREKLDIKRELKDQQLANEEDVKMLRQGFAKSLGKLRENFETNHRQLEAQYEEQVEQLKIDLELKAKVEVHEIEERKNQHINELLFNHQ